MRCVVGPTPPRALPQRDGEYAWRFISHLNLNYLSLTTPTTLQGAAALRELLRLYVPARTTRSRRGSSRGCCRSPRTPIVRRIPGSGPVAAGRGLGLTLTMDEAPFGGSGAVLLASVLERFFAKYVSINGFTETTLRCTDRGEVMRWPLRLGQSGHALMAPDVPIHGPGSQRREAAAERQTHTPSSSTRSMRELEAMHPDRPRFGRSVRPAQDAIRLASGSLRRLRLRHARRLGARRGRPRGPPVVHFFGLFGPDGPLPLHLTEYARDRLRNERDPTFQRFADLFHHRALSLMYRAWADVRPAVSFDRPEERPLRRLRGRPDAAWVRPALRDRDAMPDMTKLHFAGRWPTRPAMRKGSRPS